MGVDAIRPQVMLSPASMIAGLMLRARLESLRTVEERHAVTKVEVWARAELQRVRRW